MKKPSWLFKRLNLNLRTEVVINISLLMLAAIFLIGFTTSRANERNIIQAKIRHCENMVQDVQTIVDFILREKSELGLNPSSIRKEIQEFIQIYGKDRNLFHLLVADQDRRIIASQQTEWIDKKEDHPLLKRAMDSGGIHTEIEKEGGFLASYYKKLIIASPLWIRGKMVGGILMEVPTEDVMRRLLDYQKMFLILIIMDSIVLIVFGSFLLSRVLVKPLKGLVRLTQKISEGDFNQTIEVPSTNEIGQLVMSFNRMTEQLKEKQKNIEMHLESLELANKKLKQAQEELIRTEKLASIGRFAAGVAHEVGNPLGSILGYTSIMAREETTREEAHDYLKRIEKEIERINRIVKELLNFARPSRQDIQEVEINKVIKDTLSLLSYQKGFKNIETHLSLQPDLPMIKGNESLLSQIFINIILNAIDAMPDGGALGIETVNFVVGSREGDELESPYLSRRKDDPLDTNYSHLRSPNPFSVIFTKFNRGDRLIKVKITDTGIGIKKEDMEKIFDPFFTTKDPDKGTGLGLSISLRIIESLGGEVKVRSEEGKGSTFEVYFPVAT
ncbi:MAG: HAMP domain-containing protein [Deltaproteobacteria bacterium]|nr:HAMP domain-containing protein [Deltaproteobacteria bacterium]